ncbi:zinc ribbon domain-containing protein [Lacrimispora sp. BS-2]|uniref:Zinc ribbon domain-containing protein n=1 Tax=Lacrimispora sp. BS-2 TaxID=3151850 RepID=A0AAU7PLU9_9FIRM
MYCSNCGKKYDGSFCPDCGTPAQTGDQSKMIEEDSVFIPQSEQVNTLVYKLTAGALAINGERQLTTVFEVTGNEVTATSYRKTTKASPVSSLIFNKQEIGSVVYKKTSLLTKLEKVQIAGLSVTTLLGFVIPPLLIVGPAAIALIVFTSRKKTMIISLKSGTSIKAYYMEQEEADIVYKAISV